MPYMDALYVCLIHTGNQEFAVANNRYYRMCSVTIENVFCYYRMCSVTIECVLLL